MKEAKCIFKSWHTDPNYVLFNFPEINKEWFHAHKTAHTITHFTGYDSVNLLTKCAKINLARAKELLEGKIRLIYDLYDLDKIIDYEGN